MPQEGALEGQTLGGYRLRNLLGVGGMAEVYRAEEPSLGRDVAVKVLPRLLATDPNYVARFRAEARHVANLSHPNIVPVYTFGEERGLLYLIMPLLKESLRDRMERDGKMEPTEAGRIVYLIASALNTAHHYGIVHRDVKPENILMDGDSKPMLTDFGIAREIDALAEAGAMRTLAATGLPVGTPEYMAPEQLKGQPATPQVDIYALGVVLYEMLTARVPHDASTPYEVATAVLRDPVIAPTRINTAVSPVLEHVVLMAMSRDMGQRYPDMRAFAMDLRDALRGRAATTNSLRWTRFMPAERGGPAALPPRVMEAEDVIGAASLPAASVPAASVPAGSASAAGPTTKRSTLAVMAEMRKRGKAGNHDDISRAPTVNISGGAISAVIGGFMGGKITLDAVRDWLNALPAKLIVNKRPTPLALSALVAVAVTALIALALLAATIGNILAGGPQGQTGAHPHATALPKATTTPTYTPVVVIITATPAPTSTPSGPQKLTFSETTIALTAQSASSCRTTNPVTISNYTSATLTWRWSSSSSFNSVNYARWRLDTTSSYVFFADRSPSATLKGFNGGSTVATSQLWLSAACNASGTYPVTITDSWGRSYTLKVVIGGGG